MCLNINPSVIDLGNSAEATTLLSYSIPVNGADSKIHFPLTLASR